MCAHRQDINVRGGLVNDAVSSSDMLNDISRKAEKTLKTTMLVRVKPLTKAMLLGFSWSPRFIVATGLMSMGSRLPS